jgi:hypothetical protein
VAESGDELMPIGFNGNSGSDREKRETGFWVKNPGGV